MKRLSMIAALLLLAAPALAAPTADLVARYSYRTGTTLTSPAYVSFSAVGTTDSDADVRTFHDLDYLIDYGDSACSSGQGNWARGANGMPRNSDRAPVGGHVYECAGTFTATLTVTDSAGATSTDSVTFTVESEDAGWTAANTRCVSPSGNFTGCPSGAAQVTSADFDANLQTAAGKRTLYRCGELFAIDADMNVADASANGSLVGGYGSCAGNPFLITYNGSAELVNDPDLDGWRFRDYRLTVTGATEVTSLFSRRASGTTTISDMLFLRIEQLDVGRCPQAAVLENGTGWNDRLAMVDSVCRYVVDKSSPPTSTQYRAMYHTVRYGYYAGNLWYTDTSNAGFFRFMGFHTSYVGHNEMRVASRGQLTMQWRGKFTTVGPPDAYGVIQDNMVKDDGIEDGRNLAICWTHECSAGGADENGMDKHDFLIESNYFAYGTSKTVNVAPMQIASDDVTIRNNVIDARGAARSGGNLTAVQLSNNSTDLREPLRVEVYHNTIVRDESDAMVTTVINTSSFGSGHKARNNLIYDTADTDNSLTSGTLAESTNNVHLNASEEGCPFTGTDGACTLTGVCAPGLDVDFDCFKIRASGGSRASVYNAGYDFPDTENAGSQPYVYHDGFMGCRGTATDGPDGEWDIGAHEYGGESCVAGGGGGGGSGPNLGTGAFGTGVF